MESMALLEGKVVETTNETTNKIFQLSTPIYHSGRINPFPTCHIVHPSKINLDVSHQAGVIQFSPSNQSRKCETVYRKPFRTAMGHLYQERASILRNKKTLPATTDPL